MADLETHEEEIPAGETLEEDDLAEEIEILIQETEEKVEIQTEEIPEVEVDLETETQANLEAITQDQETIQIIDQIILVGIDEDIKSHKDINPFNLF